MLQVINNNNNILPQFNNHHNQKRSSSEQSEEVDEIRYYSLHLPSLQQYKLKEGCIGSGSYGVVRLASKLQKKCTDFSTISSSKSSLNVNNDIKQSLNTKKISQNKEDQEVPEQIENDDVEDQQEDELCAIKILSKKVMVQRKLEDHFSNEILTLKLLSQHPNVLHLEEVIENNKVFGIVTEFASGGDLLQHIKAEKKLLEPEAKIIFGQIISAIEFAHKNFFIHRDLKAENIFLTKDLQVKVGDWGFACRWSPKSKLNKVCGSIHYASPEICRGVEYIGPEVDVWSLGVLLFAMTTGNLPFFGASHQQIKTRICKGNYKCPPYLSPSLTHLIGWMLQPNPSLRCFISDIKNHPWLKQFQKIPRLVSFRDDESESESESLSESESDQEEIEDDKSGSPDSESSTNEEQSKNEEQDQDPKQANNYFSHLPTTHQQQLHERFTAESTQNVPLVIDREEEKKEKELEKPVKRKSKFRLDQLLEKVYGLVSDKRKSKKKKIKK